MSWVVVLLEDEVCGQETLAVCDQFGQQMTNIVVGVDFGLLFHEEQLALDGSTHSSRHHQVLGKLFAFNEQTIGTDVSLFPVGQTRLFCLLTGGFRQQFFWSVISMIISQRQK